MLITNKLFRLIPLLLILCVLGLLIIGAKSCAKGKGSSRIGSSSYDTFVINAPSNLNATTASGFQIDLAWSDNSNNEDGFEIYRSINGIIWGATPIGTTGPNVAVYSDTVVLPLNFYYYRVRAFNTIGDRSDYSNTAFAITFDYNWLPVSWTAMSSSYLHTIAIGNNGTLWTWGINRFGELGLGDIVNRVFPVQITSDWTYRLIGSDKDWATVVANAYNTATIKTNGTLWIWGYNGNGQMGYGDNTYDETLPVPVGTDSDWSSIALGYGSVFGIKNNGSMYAWGNNFSGMLGLGDTESRYTPTQFSAQDWLNVSAKAHTLVLKTNRTLWSCGWNNAGQLGLGYNTPTNEVIQTTTPTQIGTSSDWSEVSAGGRIEVVYYSAPDLLTGYSLGLKTNGTIYSWGSNHSGQLGLGTTNSSIHSTPSQIDTASDWAEISAGAAHSLARKTNGTIWSWGLNTWGQLGDGTQNKRYSPGAIGTDSDWSQISAGEFQSFALKTSGMLYVWGANFYGELGMGDNTIRTVPCILCSPTPPSYLSVAVNSSSRVDLFWGDVAFNESGYTIERKTGLTGTWETVAVLSANTNLYSDTVITPGNAYYYRIRAYNSLGTSAYSAVADTTPVTPSNLALAVISCSQLNLTWIDNSSNELGFIVERAYSGTDFTQIATVPAQNGIANTINYSDTTVTPDNTYTYRVRSYHYFGQSPPSNEINGIPILFPPSSLIITATLLSHIDMKWNDNSIDEDGFVIERKVGEDSSWQPLNTVGENIKSYSDTNNLVVGQRYYYQIKAYNADTESDYSGSANTMITFPSLLICRVISSTQIDLSWNDVSSDETGFKVERKINNNSWETIGTVTFNIDKYTDISTAGFSTSDIYYYRIVFIKGLEEYIYTNQPAIMISRVWVDIAAGSNYNIARDNNGMLWSWGNNTYGQLGLGDIANRWFPDLIGTDSDWRLMVCSKEQSSMTLFSLALKTNGSLWAWGDNSKGQLGFGNTTFNPWESVQVGTHTDWAIIAVGKAHSLAIKTNPADGGTIWSWGYNSKYQLGLNDINDRYTPVQIGTKSDWSSIAAGYEYSLAIKTNLTLWAWGDNSKGQLGGYGITAKHTPAQIGSLSDWSSVAAGNQHTISLKTNGTLWTWGYNMSGQLGVGNSIDKYTPIQVGIQSDWSFVTGGSSHSIAIKTNKTIWIWGYNASSQLGLGDAVNRNTPTQVGNESDWVKAGGGVYHTIALKTDGTLWSWGCSGYNVHFGQLGLGDTFARISPCKFNTPTPPSALTATISALAVINLSWQDNAVSEDGFKIERKVEGGSYAQIGTTSRNVISYTDTVGLSENGIYYYRVRSFNSDGDSPFSNEVRMVNSVTLPDAPTSLTATPYSCMRINIFWTDASNNESGFIIERKTEITGTYSTRVVLPTANITSYSDITQGDSGYGGTVYYYRVKAYNNFGSSGYSNEDIAVSLPWIPVLPSSFTATAISGTRITLAWVNDPDNTFINMPYYSYYIIEKSYDGVDFFSSVTVSFTSQVWNDTDVTPTNTYYYKMKTYNMWGESGYSDIISATTPVIPPSAPSGLTVTAVSSSQVALFWNDNSSDENGFNIERSPITNTSYSIIGTVDADATSYLDSGLSLGELYYYRVLAYIGSTNSLSSNEVNITATLLAPLYITGTAISPTRIDIAWTNVDNEDGYKIERKEGLGGTFSQIGTTNTDILAYSDTTVTFSVTYYYRVMAYKGSINGVYSQIIKVGAYGTWAMVKSGTYHTIARESNGAIWAWGDNGYGQLGDPDIGDTNNGYLKDQVIPNRIGTDLDWSKITVGNYHTLGVKNSGTLWAWGDNTSGQLGDPDIGPIKDQAIPNQIGTGADWSMIAGGSSYTIGIKTNCTIWSWGLNAKGQLGLGDSGTGYERYTPTRIGSLSDWSIIAAGSTHSIALKNNKTIWVWGLNDKGQLGLGYTTPSTTGVITPTQIAPDSDWFTVSAGGNHSIGIKTDGTIWSWGKNEYGQLGLGYTTPSTTGVTAPVKINNDSDWADVVAGNAHTIAIKTNNTIWAWGLSTSGQLGILPQVNRNTPTQIGNNSDWSVITAGYSQSFGLTSTKNLWSWGNNNIGQLGLGDMVNRTTPTMVGE